MKLYINGRFLTQKQTGIPRFAYQMCLAMHQLGVNFEVLAPKNILSSYDCPFKVTVCGALKGHLWEQISLPLYLKKFSDALLISFSGLGPIFKKKHIATIHDIAFMVNKKWFSVPYRILYGCLTPILVRHCSKILTVSQFSKNEIVKYLHVDPAKIEVVYNAVSSELSATSSIDSVDERFTQPYLLAVSSIDPRKNFKMLVDAFLSSGISTHKLYIIGGKATSFGEVGLDISNSGQVEFLGFVDDALLKQAYKNASLFVYPSLYEGFGIPPIEAMSAGCPVLVSDIDVFHEVNEDAAWYCNPNDKESIIAQIQFILSSENRPLVEQKIKLGKQQSQKYDWQHSANQLKNILKKLVV